MRLTFALLSMAALCASARAQCGAVFSYPDFSSTAGLTLSGDADVDGDALRLTRAGLGGAGSAWYTTSRAGLNAGFRTSFQWKIDRGTADGFAFVMQDSSDTALGGSGSGLGYEGISRSVAIEFDTFYFGDEFQGYHVSVQSRGADGNESSDAASLAHVLLPEERLTGPHEARIEYTPGALYVSIDGEPVLFCPLDLGSLDDGTALFSDNGCAWVGFTGGAGAATADQTISSWVFTDWSDVQGCEGMDSDQFEGPWDTPQTGDRVVFRASAAGSGPRVYQWRRGEAELSDDSRIVGARSEVMVIDPFIPADAGAYSFEASNECSGYRIGDWTVSIRCPGDLNEDGLVDDADFSIFVVSYEALLVPDADKRCDWNGDRLVDDTDFVLFLPWYDNLLCE